MNFLFLTALQIFAFNEPIDFPGRFIQFFD